MNDKELVDKLYNDINFSIIVSELELHVHAAKCAIQTDDYELYLYNKSYVRIYLKELDEYENDSQVLHRLYRS